MKEIGAMDTTAALVYVTSDSRGKIAHIAHTGDTQVFAIEDDGFDNIEFVSLTDNDGLAKKAFGGN